MTKKSIVAGLSVGFIMGSAIGMSMMPQRRHAKKIVNKAVRAISDAFENLTESLNM